MERVTLLPLGGEGALQAIEEAIDSFDVWRAHCFDPNEELKLRRIVAEIGEGSFQKLKRTLQWLWARTLAERRGACGCGRTAEEMAQEEAERADSMLRLADPATLLPH